jgi:hypothetical protein
MPTSEHYRKLAAECRRNADEADDPDERDTLLRIAALWDELAERKAGNMTGLGQQQEQPRHVGQQQQPDDDKKA